MEGGQESGAWSQAPGAGSNEPSPLHTKYEDALSLAREKLGTYLSKEAWAHAEYLLYDQECFYPNSTNAHGRMMKAIDIAEAYEEKIGPWEASDEGNQFAESAW